MKTMVKCFARRVLLYVKHIDGRIEEEDIGLRVVAVKKDGNDLLEG